MSLQPLLSRNVHHHPITHKEINQEIYEFLLREGFKKIHHAPHHYAAHFVMEATAHTCHNFNTYTITVGSCNIRMVVKKSNHPQIEPIFNSLYEGVEDFMELYQKVVDLVHSW